MQRPRLMKTRCSATAAELEQWWGCERKKTKREKNGKDQGVPIYKGISKQAGAKIEEDPNNDYPTKRTPRFSEDIKR